MDTSANLINNELIYSTITNTEQDVESKTDVDNLQNRMYSNNQHQTQRNQFTYETPDVVSPGIPQFTYETPDVVAATLVRYSRKPRFPLGGGVGEHRFPPYETPDVVAATLCTGIAQYTNVLLIDIRVPSHKTFVDSVNVDTLPIVYSSDCSSTKLLEFLRSTFTSIPRLGYCFVSNGDTPTVFLDNTPLFPTTLSSEQENAENANSNVQFIVNLINEFSINHIDFLGCNTLNYSKWKNYYDFLTKSTGVIVGASDDKTGNLKQGGDWIMESTRQDIERIYFTESIENYNYLLDNAEWITTSPTSSLSPIPNPLAMACDGTYIYGSYFDSTKNSIFRIHIATKTVELSWISNNELKTYIWQMVVYNGQLYGTLGSGSVFRIDTANPSNYTFNLFPKVSIFFRGIAAHNNKLYITSYNTANIYVYNLSTSQMETTEFVGSTIRTYLSSLSITATNQQIALGVLLIYNNYLYAATNESGGTVNRVFRWSLSAPLTDNSMNFMAQGTDTFVSQSILPNRVGGWVLVNNQLYFVRNNTPNIISRLNLDNLSDYTYNYYTLPTNNINIDSGLTSDSVNLYFQDKTPKFYQINLIRPTTPTSTVSIESTYTVSPGNLRVSIIDPSNGYNDVYYQYSITGVNGNVFVTANTFSTGVSSFGFYVSNLFALNDIVYTINVVAKNLLGTSAVASREVLLYTLPAQITNCSVLYVDGNINVSITESSPPTYYYLNNVSYLYYLYSSGTNQSSNLLAYTVGANITAASYTTNFAIPNIPVTTTKYKIYVIARNQLGNTIANSFSTNVYSIPSATVSFDTGNTKTVSSGNLKVQFVDPSNISINDVYYHYSVNNNVDASFANTFVRANVSPYSFFVPTTDISNTIYLKAVNPIGKSSPEANLPVIVYQTPRQPSVKFNLVSSGNVQLTIMESTTTPVPYYYLNEVSYYLYVYNTFGGNNLSGNTSTLVYNKPVGVLSNTNSTYENIVSYVNTGLSANTYTMYVIAVNSVGVSAPVYGNIDVYITNPVAPTIDTGNTLSSTSGTLTVSITDNVNRISNGIYYWYSTDNITYANSRVAKTVNTTYRFTINDTGNVLVPLVAQPYSIYVRAVNPLGYATSIPFASKVYTTPQLPTIVEDNTYLTSNKRLTVSFIDAVNSSTNDIYYWYSTDNITYANSRVAKTTDTAYQFTITDTGNVLVPLRVANYSLYIRAQNPLGNVTTIYYNVPIRNIPASEWLAYEKNSNKFKQSYFMNFIDVNGECIVRNGSITVDNDGKFSGNLSTSKNIEIIGSANILTDLLVDKNVSVNNNLSVRETANLNRVNAIGDASFNTNIYVSNNTNLNKLSVAGDASVNGNMVILKNTIHNQNTTIMGKIYGASDMNIAGKTTIEQDSSLLSSLGVFGNTNLYGYRNFPVLNMLRTTNVYADYNFLERSVTFDPINSDASINNPFVLNSFTNTTDAAFESISKVNISSGGIMYYYAGGTSIGSLFNDGGLLTNPVPSQSLTNVTTHMLVNFVSTTSAITWDFFEILTKTDASYSSLYTFKLVSNNRINPDGSNNQFVISNNNSTSNILSNSTLQSGTNIWISVSQNIQNGDSSVYFNGNLVCSFTSVVASSTVQPYIAYSIGYSRSASTLDPAINTGSKTIKRVIIDSNGKYTSANLPQIIDVFNTYTTLYVSPVCNVNSDSIVVNGDANIKNNVDIMKNTNINQQLIVVGDVSFGSNLVVSKNTNINQQLNVVGDVSFGSNLIVSKNATINQQLNVFGDASFNKNITANTISIIGDVSFISPVGTLYANSIKLKRTPGIVGTTTNIESNTISTGVINVDTLNAINGVNSNYITAAGAITTNSLFVEDSNTSVTIASGAVTASSFTAKGSRFTAAAGEMVALKLRITDSIDTQALHAVSISTDTSISTSGGITAANDIKAESFATKYVSAVAGEISGEKLKASDTITATNTVTAGSFATTGKTANSGEVKCENITATNSITASGVITALSFQTTNPSSVISTGGPINAASFKTILATNPVDIGGISVTTVKANDTITSDAAVIGQSFNTTNVSCEITSSGKVTASSFATTGRTAVDGEINGSRLTVGNTITANGMVSADSFKTSNSSSTISSSGDVIASSFATTGRTAVAGQVNANTITVGNTVTASGAITAASFATTGRTAVAGEVNANTITVGSTVTASGAITAASFATTGRTAVAGEVNANTITVGNTVTAASFTTTGRTAVTGQVTVSTVNATGQVTAASFNATSDKRLKQNINEMPSQWDKIKALVPSEYHWSENSKYDCGFIAQQIYTVYPHLRPNLENVVIREDDCPVTKDSGEPVYYTIDYGKMTPYLCKGLQEVMSETEQLKREIAELKAQIQSMQK